MIVPYSTDAPLYHWPIVTVSLIIINVAMFFSTTFLVMIDVLKFEQIQWLALQFDQINPLQWITCAFVHDGIGHLFSNMFFLFVFGLIVEGKVGNLRFLSIYLLVCAAVGFCIQTPMFFLSGTGGMVGASAAIYALMVIALFWAPENDVECFYWFIVFGRFETQISTFAAYFVAIDAFIVVWTGLAMSSATAHTVGALLGLPVAVYFLRTEKVDCEGWDVVSRNDWLKKYSVLYGEKQRQRDAEKEGEIFDPVSSALSIDGADKDAASWLGTRSLPEHAAAARDERKRKDSLRKANAGKPKPKYKRERRPAAEVLEARCRAHPEFNRLAYVFRETMNSGNLIEAQRVFLRMDSMRIAHGLQEQVLMDYASQFGKSKKWTDAVRPLVILIEKQGVMADDARLRLAQIQMHVMKRRDLAISTLKQIRMPEQGSADAHAIQRVQKRDELLRAAQTES